MRSLVKSALVALALAGHAYADACSGCSNDCQVTADGDETPIGSCTTFKGSISVSGEGVTNLDFGSIVTIGGDLTIKNVTNLLSVSAQQLRTIDGTLTVEVATSLDAFSMPQLSSVKALLMQTCPALTSLGTAITQAESVVISDTHLGSLAGVTLKTVGVLDINNNNFLSQVIIPGLKTITTSLNVAFNGQKSGSPLQVSLSNLIWAVNATFRDVDSISLPALGTVNGSIGFYNDTFQSLTLPNLTSTGDSFTVANCSAVTNISCNALTTIGGTFQLANNTNLLVIDGFPKVKFVGGAVDFSGSFTNATLPSLGDVKGGFNLQTSADFDCSEFDADKGTVIEGEDYFCAGKETNPGTKGNNPSGTDSSTSPTSTKKGAASQVQISFGLGVLAAVVGLVSVL